MTDVRVSLLFVACLLAWQPFAGAAEAPALPHNSQMNGIWSGEQGVLWDTSVKPGRGLGRLSRPNTRRATRKRSMHPPAASPRRIPRPAACLPACRASWRRRFPFEIVQTPEITYILYEYMSQIRRVYMTGAAPPAMGLPTFNGRSTGTLGRIDAGHRDHRHEPDFGARYDAPSHQRCLEGD